MPQMPMGPDGKPLEVPPEVAANAEGQEEQNPDKIAEDITEGLSALQSLMAAKPELKDAASKMADIQAQFTDLVDSLTGGKPAGASNPTPPEQAGNPNAVKAY